MEHVHFHNNLEAFQFRVLPQVAYNFGFETSYFLSGRFHYQKMFTTSFFILKNKMLELYGRGDAHVKSLNFRSCVWSNKLEFDVGQFEKFENSAICAAIVNQNDHFGSR